LTFVGVGGLLGTGLKAVFWTQALGFLGMWGLLNVDRCISL
jgi:hypothetical protein